MDGRAEGGDRGTGRGRKGPLRRVRVREEGGGDRRSAVFGVKTLEDLERSLEKAPDWQKPMLLVRLMPRGVGQGTLERLLVRHGVHPLSMALAFLNRRRARALLERLGLDETYGDWIRAGGRLLLRGSEVRRLPPGLVLRGSSVIEDCPELVDLGAGLTVLAGHLTVARCPRLRRLPEGLRLLPLPGIEVWEEDRGAWAPPFTGDLVLEDCPALGLPEGGWESSGRLLVRNCPGVERDLAAGMGTLSGRGGAVLA